MSFSKTLDPLLITGSTNQPRKTGSDITEKLLTESKNQNKKNLIHMLWMLTRISLPDYSFVFSQHMFWLRNEKTVLNYTLLSGDLIWLGCDGIIHYPP